MEKSVKITLIIAGTILALALLGFYAFNQMGEKPKVSTSGSAEIKVMPDLITVYFNVQTEALTSKEANDNNSAIVDNVITALVKLGLERKDIVTESFNIYPQYNWDNGKQTNNGYIATHSLKVQLSANKSEKVGSIIDAGVNAGALVQYINFELSLASQNNYKAQALKQATEDARIKAQAIADGSGESLGALISVSDSSFNYYPWRLYASASEAGTAASADVKQATTNIQPGEETVSAMITATYQLK